MPEIATVCPYCGCGCGLYLHVEDGRVVGGSPSRLHPVSQGRLCVKGWHAHEVVDNPSRLTRPLVRREKGLVEASWQEALEAVAAGLSKVMEAEGPQGIGVLGSARCTNEDNYLLVRFARGTLGTPNIDCSAWIQCAPGLGGTRAGKIEDLDAADLIVLVGSDPTEEHPAVAARIFRARERGARLVVAGARKHRLARLADVHLPVRPGEELRWMRSLLHVLLVEERATTESDVPEIAELRVSTTDLRPEETQAATDVRAQDLRKAVRLCRASKQAVILCSAGLALSPEAGRVVYLLHRLGALSASVGGPQLSVLGLLSRNNLQGCRDMGVAPDLLPGYAPIGDDAAAKRFEQAWKCKVARARGLSAWEMLGKVRAMYIMGDDVTRSLPDAEAARAALEGLDFLVVQDIFMSPAASMADVVLPAAAFAERDGTWTSLERRVQGIRQAVAPPGEAREDWRIIADVSRAMGKAFPYKSTGEIFQEIARLAPIYAGIPFPPPVADGGVRWPAAEGQAATGSAGGREEAAAKPPADAREAGAETDEQYPLLLAADPTLRPWDAEVTVCHTLTAAVEFTVLARDYPDGMLCLNPDDARRFGLRGGRAARVVSAKGESKMQVRVTEETPPGIALVPYHQATRSGLMAIAADPASGRPVLAPTPISVGPVQ